jgi:metal-dependent hydrolase (beta-lactamase superfamily II)
MAYFTESELRGYANRLRNSATNFSNIIRAKEESAVAAATIFLSHSHKDREEAEGLVYYLASLNIKVYVDWNDSNMPRMTNKETAEKIKVEIKTKALFMILATRNALESRWVPWEIGIADQCKGDQRMLLIPVADHSGRFDGNEYLQLYKRAEEAAAGGYGVFAPGQTSGTTLEQFIRQYGS